MRLLGIISSLVLMAPIQGVALPLVAASSPSEVESVVINALEKRYLGCRIEILEIKHEPEAEVHSVLSISEDGKGGARLVVRAKNRRLLPEIYVRFAAWKPAPVAVRRISPYEKLSSDLFEIREINLAEGLARQYKGLILSSDAEFETLQTRQTILEGYYPLISGVERIPDVSRGENVRIILSSGNLKLVAPGLAQENAYVGSAVRVTSQRTKKQMSGKLVSKGVVEVNL